LFLPFLPMLPIQIILNNFLYDMSQLPVSSDNVDDDDVKKPKPWHISSIKNFMITLGPVSTIFDIITFLVLLWILKSPESTFQTMWFLESIFTVFKLKGSFKVVNLLISNGADVNDRLTAGDAAGWSQSGSCPRQSSAWASRTARPCPPARPGH